MDGRPFRSTAGPVPGSHAPGRSSSASPPGASGDARSGSNAEPRTPRRNRQPLPPEAIDDVLIPKLLQTAGCPRDAINAETFREYRNMFVRELAPRDRLERVMIEQVVTAHLMTMQLHACTGIAPTADAAGVYSSAAARLMAEVRRSVMAIRELQNPARARSSEPAERPVNVNQHVVVTSTPPIIPGVAQEKDADTELTSKEELALAYDNSDAQILRQSSRWVFEPAEARAAD